ncbi:hypothetical protein QL093DRAFT_2519003 [Fusarium oxysporum]|nr:hypothetical protein QL093DRAFT_2519003 [Fusarium oxysporum]
MLRRYLPLRATTTIVPLNCAIVQSLCYSYEGLIVILTGLLLAGLIKVGCLTK